MKFNGPGLLECVPCLKKISLILLAVLTLGVGFIAVIPMYTYSIRQLALMKRHLATRIRTRRLYWGELHVHTAGPA